MPGRSSSSNLVFFEDIFNLSLIFLCILPLSPSTKFCSDPPYICGEIYLLRCLNLCGREKSGGGSAKKSPIRKIMLPMVLPIGWSFPLGPSVAIILPNCQRVGTGAENPIGTSSGYHSKDYYISHFIVCLTLSVYLLQYILFHSFKFKYLIHPIITVNSFFGSSFWILFFVLHSVHWHI